VNSVGTGNGDEKVVAVGSKFGVWRCGRLMAKGNVRQGSGVGGILLRGDGNCAQADERDGVAGGVEWQKDQ
jgi:hypothetical protein